LIYDIVDVINQILGGDCPVLDVIGVALPGRHVSLEVMVHCVHERCLVDSAARALFRSHWRLR